jgi:hypothetical protein
MFRTFFTSGVVGGESQSPPDNFGMHARASPDSICATTAPEIGLISLMILVSYHNKNESNA